MGLESVGITELHDLKDRLDSYASRSGKVPSKSGADKVHLESHDMVAFLEQLGLWDEANAERFRVQNRKRAKKRSSKAKRRKLETPTKVSKPPKGRAKSG